MLLISDLFRWAPVCLVLILLGGGCSTPFSAVSVNPLRSVPTPEWDPGEISRTSQSILDARGWGVAWQSRPSAAVAVLEFEIGDPWVRRAVVEIALAAAIDQQRHGDRRHECDELYLRAVEHSADLKEDRSDAFGAFAERASRYAVSRLVDRHGQALWDSRRAVPHFLAGPRRRYQLSRKTSTPPEVIPGHWTRVVPVDRFSCFGGSTDLAYLGSRGCLRRKGGDSSNEPRVWR